MLGNIARLFERSFDKDRLFVLDIVRDLVRSKGGNLYIVGGSVRDLILESRVDDIDLAIDVEDIESIGSSLADILSGDLKIYKRLKSATVHSKSGIKIDIAVTRKESYPQKASLPVFEQVVDIYQDLPRRDFTINAIALDITSDQNFKLIDPLSGISDIKNKVLKVIHPKSFEDDPTRLFRMVKFIARFGFHPDRFTLLVAEDAIANSYPELLSGFRIIREIKLILKEVDPVLNLEKLEEISLLKFLSSSIIITEKMKARYRKLSSIFDSYLDLISKEKITDSWFIPDKVYLYMISLIYDLDIPDIEVMSNTYKDKEERDLFLRVVMMKQDEDRFLSLSFERASELYLEFKRKRIEELLFFCHLGFSDYIGSVLRYHGMRTTVPLFDGFDLLKLGLKPSPVFGKVLEDLFLKQLDGFVTVKTDILKVISESGYLKG